MLETTCFEASSSQSVIANLAQLAGAEFKVVFVSEFDRTVWECVLDITMQRERSWGTYLAWIRDQFNVSVFQEPQSKHPIISPWAPKAGENWKLSTMTHSNMCQFAFYTPSYTMNDKSHWPMQNPKTKKTQSTRGGIKMNETILLSPTGMKQKETPPYACTTDYMSVSNKRFLSMLGIIHGAGKGSKVSYGVEGREGIG
jgi:hypothetical protein